MNTIELFFTIDPEIWGVTAILAAALIALGTEIISVDRTAIGIMAALMVSGISTPREAVAGFSNPAVITVAALFIISRGMIRSGVVGSVAQKFIDISRGNRNTAVAITLLVVALSSAFINNTPVVILFIPILFTLSCEYDFSPSKFLTPMSYVSILAGTCTLIGTSTNIIISDLSERHGYGFITMFELAALGVPNALLGICLILVTARYLMPAHAAPVCELETRRDQRYLAEVLVTRDSPLIGQDPDTALQDTYPTLQVVEIVRGSKIIDPSGPAEMFRPADLLLVRGSASDLVSILQKKSVELPHAQPKMGFGPDDDELIVELIVAPESTLVRQRLASTNLRGDPQVHIIAIKRQGRHFGDRKIRDIRLREGNTLLVRAPRERLKRLRGESDFLILEDIHHQIVFKGKARWAVSIFGGVVLAASTGLADIMVSAVTGVLLMSLFRCIQLQRS